MLTSLLIACGGKRRAEQAIGLTLLSPSSAAATVNARVIALEFAATRITEVRCRHSVTGQEVVAVRSGSSFFALDVELVPGTNEIVASGTDDRGRSVQTGLRLQLAPGENYSLAWTAAPERIESTPATVALDLTYNLPLPPREVLVDIERDGQFESVLPFAPRIDATVAQAGIFKPKVLLRTQDNQLIAMDDDHAPSVRVVAGVTFAPAFEYAGAGNGVTDLDYDPAANQLFVLAATDRTVRVFDANRTLVRTISVAALTDASGIGLDRDKNLYVADAGTHRILKLLAPNYTPDALVGPGGLFGAQGNGNGQFQTPRDVAAEGTGNDVRIFVADTGNSRVQRFNRAGVHELTIAALAGGATLTTPLSLQPIPSGGIAVLEPSRVRILTSDGSAVAEFSPLQDARRLTTDWNTSGLVVLDEGGSRVAQFGWNGGLRRATGLATPADAAIVITVNQGGLLVTGRRNSTVLAAGILPQDPPGEDPVAVTTAFLAAIAADNRAAARTLVADSELFVFDAAAGDPAAWTRVRTDSAGVTALTLVEADEGTAFVRGLRDNGTATVPAEFVLVRDEATGRWTLKNF